MEVFPSGFGEAIEHEFKDSLREAYEKSLRSDPNRFPFGEDDIDFYDVENSSDILTRSGFYNEEFYQTTFDAVNITDDDLKDKDYVPEPEPGPSNRKSNQGRSKRNSQAKKCEKNNESGSEPKKRGRKKAGSIGTSPNDSKSIVASYQEANEPEDEETRAMLENSDEKSLQLMNDEQRPKKFAAVEISQLKHFTPELPELSVFGTLVDLFDKAMKKYSQFIQPSFQINKLIKFNAKRRLKYGIRAIMHHEYLAWLISVAVQRKNMSKYDSSLTSINPNNFLIPFVRHLASIFPKVSDPVFTVYTNVFFQAVTIRTEEFFVRYHSVLLCLKSMMARWFDTITSTICRKAMLRDHLWHITDELKNTSIQFDETSIWGLKPIRLALEPPYFKSDSAFTCSPLLLPKIDPKHKSCFIMKETLKWTTKDLAALKQCIKEAIQERQLSLVSYRYDLCLRDLDDQRLKARLGAMNFEQEPVRKTRGRKPKVTYPEGSINLPRFKQCPETESMACSVSVQVTAKSMAEWKTAEDKKIKSKTYETLVNENMQDINFELVAELVTNKTRKPRSVEACQSAFFQELHPSLSSKRWSSFETEHLKTITTDNDDISWVEIPFIIPTVKTVKCPEPKKYRTPYQCFLRYRTKIRPPSKMVWDERKDKLVIDMLAKNGTKWHAITSALDDPAATKKQLLERYKKCINPVLRQGAFTRVEDCLLLLTIEHLKAFIMEEGHFGVLLSYLPWRFETTWRDRANNLFSDWIIPWTLEEDQHLLKLAVTMKRNWQKISEQFISFKNRKGCLTRFKILQRRMGKSSKFESLEAYHESYAMTRYNVFQYRHLNEILELLKRIYCLAPPDYKFPGLLNSRAPTEPELRWMLMSFDREIMKCTIDSLDKYVASRNYYWSKWMQKNKAKKRTFDRRTFHAEDPQSVASALHIRGLKLVPKHFFINLNNFEEEIYKFFARFSRTKALKKTTARPYIPSAASLASWSVISRIVDQKSLEELKEDPNIICCELNTSSKRKRPEDETEFSTPKRKYNKKVINANYAPRKRGRKSKASKSEPIIPTYELPEIEGICDSDFIDAGYARITRSRSKVIGDGTNHFIP